MPSNSINANRPTWREAAAGVHLGLKPPKLTQSSTGCPGPRQSLIT